MLLIVEPWLNKRGHSLVPLSNPGFVLEMGLEGSERGALLGRVEWRAWGTGAGGSCRAAASCLLAALCLIVASAWR